MAATIFQINLNHACQAQNLFLHTLAEHGGGIGIISEPYRIPEGNLNWAADHTGTAAVVWRTNQDLPPCTSVEQHEGIVVVDWRQYTIINVYISPSVPLQKYEEWLEKLTECVGKRPSRPKIIAGDFNARSQLWGDCRTTVKGKAVEDWAAQNGLMLVNRGTVSTCIRQQGESTIDLTWASPAAARRIDRWRMAEDIETLSDHRAIVYEIHAAPLASESKEWKANRWAVKKMDEDMLRASLEPSTWTQG